jgi:hypothetical protein
MFNIEINFFYLATTNDKTSNNSVRLISLFVKRFINTLLNSIAYFCFLSTFSTNIHLEKLLSI